MGVGMGLVLLLVSAGLIAYVGDLLGRRIGRKRLTLFGMRPKNTAILVTVLTGTGIAAVTMAFIFWTSRDLRERIFGYERTVGKLRQEAASSQTAAARSKGELAAAEQDLATQRQRVTEEQRAADLAAKARNEAERQLTAAQARYQQAVSRLAAAASKLAVAQKQVRDAQARVQATQARMAELTATKRRLDADVKSLTAQREQVAKELAAARTELSNAEKELANATRVASDLARAAEKYRAEAARILEGTQQDVARVLDATAGAIVYHSAEELDRELIRDPSLEATTLAVQQMVRRINDRAKARGAAEYDKERLPGVVAVAIGRGADNTTLLPADYLPAVVRFLVNEGRPAWLRAQVVANCFPGRPLFYTFRLVADRVAFRNGAELARTTMDGAQDELTLVEALRSFVVNGVRPATEAAGMLPPLTGVNEVGPAVWLPALHMIQGVGGPVTVSAVATRDIGVGDTLTNAIEFHVTANP
mgnify:CR=1 FL=1